MAVDAGAEPDENAPVNSWGHDESPWVDEDFDEEDMPTGISHAGGEITDTARIWFERSTRRYTPSLLSYISIH